MLRLDWMGFADLIVSPVRRTDLADELGGLLVVVQPPAPGAAQACPPVDALAGLGAVVALDADQDDVAPEVLALVDVVASGGVLGTVAANVEAQPQAALSLVHLLRDEGPRSVAARLAGESAVYSTLQAGAEFGRWRDTRPVRHRGDDERPRVSMERVGDELVVTSTRPEVRNALDQRMRDALWEAFAVVRADPDLRLRWRGAGPSFSTGGDLDEFGTRPDPATAHLVRLARSLGLVLSEVADRTTVEVHGQCSGSGVELAAFAGRVVASPDTTFTLPELALGLIPGAGGTVSLPDRIGRHRTAWMVLSALPVQASRALQWGLVDEVAPLPS